MLINIEPDTKMDRLDHWSKIALTNIRASGDHSTNKLIVSLMHDATKVVKNSQFALEQTLVWGNVIQTIFKSLILLEH